MGIARRLVLGVAAMSLGAMLLAACGTSSSTAKPAATTPSSQAVSVVRGGVVKYAEVAGGNPNYIFPVETDSEFTVYNVAEFIPLMYKYLWQSNYTQPTINYSESIGNRPVWSHGDTVVTVTLKHYLWSNGTPVTTRDITFFVNLVKAAGANWGDYTPGDFPYNVKAMTIESPTKMTFTLTKPYNPTYYVDNQLSDIIPIPQNVWDRTSLTGKVGNYDETPAGAKAVWNFLNSYSEKTSTYSSTNPIWGDIDGPFELSSFGGSASPDIFVPNRRYSGHRATISEFEELPFTSNAAEYDLLRSGNGAISVGYVPASDVPTIPTVRAAGYKVSQVYQWAVDYMIPNLKNPTVGPILSQLYIRQVLQHLTDQETMIKRFLYGYGTPTYGPVPIYPKGNRFADAYEAKDLYPYSVATAKALLRAHGWRMKGGVQTCEDASACGPGVKAGSQLKLSLLYSSGSTALTEQNELLASDAAKAGVIITLRQESFNAVVGNVAACTPGQNGMSATSPQCTWELGEYGGNSFGLYPSGGDLFLLGASENAGQYDNSAVNSLIHEVRHSSSLKPFYQYEDVVARDLPWIWQPTASDIAAVATNLHGPGISSEFGSTIPANRWYFTKK